MKVVEVEGLETKGWSHTVRVCIRRLLHFQASWLITQVFVEDVDPSKPFDIDALLKDKV